MGPEINIVSIRSLEKHLKEGMGDMIQLKRARNSLLNITTRVPPEILGYIFRWNVIPGGDYPYIGEVRRGSYNFLLVCYHWFEVASRTPELWSFWGNGLRQWSLRYKHSVGATPVDLVLDGKHPGAPLTYLNESLRGALRERTKCDAIRSVHLKCKAKILLTTVLSLLTPDGEEMRDSSIEAITIRHVDVSNFLARYRFPKLHYLHLSWGVGMTSWEHLGLHTTALTTLHLAPGGNPQSLTTSQLLSILVSNPRLQDLYLSKSAVPRKNEAGSTFRVPLRHLKKLSLTRDFRSVFQLLSRLDHPESMDGMKLTVFRCTTEEVLGTIGPYLQDYLQRDGRFRDGLGIYVESSSDSISIQATTTSGVKYPTRKVTFAMVTAVLLTELPPSAQDKLCIDFVAHTPREHVVFFGGFLNVAAVKEIVPMMPGIKEVYITGAKLGQGFLQLETNGPLANTKLFPSLRHLHLDNAIVEDDRWGLLLPYLIHQTSVGQAISLTLSGGRYHICEDVLEDIQGLVDGLTIDLILDEYCSFDRCSMDDSEEEDYWWPVGGPEEVRLVPAAGWGLFTPSGAS